MLYCNFAVAFVDLLGQREEMRAHRILPENQDEALRIAKSSVGRVFAMHKTFQTFYDSFSSVPTVFERLPPDERKKLVGMSRGELRSQRFSDGLVLYTPLMEKDHSPVSSVFALIAAAGSLTLVQLAGGVPVRVGIDIGWGIEERPGELYGACLAHAYELESKVAQWPRAVVGEDLRNYLLHMQVSPGTSMADEFRRQTAKSCLEHLVADSDGRYIVDFVGPLFIKMTGDENARTLDDTFNAAYAFVEAQIDKWSSCGNTELAGRYICLRRYLQTREPHRKP